MGFTVFIWLFHCSNQWPLKESVGSHKDKSAHCFLSACDEKKKGASYSAILVPNPITGILKYIINHKFMIFADKRELQQTNISPRKKGKSLTAGPGAPTTPWRPVGPGGP